MFSLSDRIRQILLGIAFLLPTPPLEHQLSLKRMLAMAMSAIKLASYATTLGSHVTQRTCLDLCQCDIRAGKGTSHIMSFSRPNYKIAFSIIAMAFHPWTMLCSSLGTNADSDATKHFQKPHRRFSPSLSLQKGSDVFLPRLCQDRSFRKDTMKEKYEYSTKPAGHFFRDKKDQTNEDKHNYHLLGTSFFIFQELIRKVFIDRFKISPVGIQHPHAALPPLLLQGCVCTCVF